jgi:integrase
MKTSATREKGKPIETIESKGVKIPLYDAGDGKVIISFYAEGKRKLVKCKSLEAAREEAKVKIQELTKGTAHVGTLTPRQLAVVTDATEILRGVGIPLSQVAREYAEGFKILGRQPLVLKACEHYAAYLERQKTMHAPVKFPVVVDEFLLAIKDRSPRYIEDCTSRLGRAKKAFRGYIQSITATTIEAWFDSMKAAGRTRNNYRSTLNTLFAFARSRGYLPRNERTESELTMKASDRGGDIGIYTPAELATMLSAIEARFLPLVALGGLAGLRTAEIHKLEWQDIDLHGGHIVVGKSKAKTRQRRIVPILPALRSWLEPYAQASGPVVPQYSGDAPLLRAFRQALEPLKIKTVANGLRHSFASYRLAAVQSAEQVALEMGNSPKKLFQNYRELVTPAQAKLWFSVQPAQHENVVAISAA